VFSFYRARYSGAPVNQKRSADGQQTTNVPTARKENGDLDELVLEIRQVPRGATLEAMLRMGELVVARLWSGRSESWGRRARGDASFRQLAAHPDLSVSASFLCRSVELYELWQALGRVFPWPSLTAAHYQEVLGLPLEDQKRLLQAATDDRWTARRLRDEARPIRRDLRERRGRPPTMPLVRNARAIGTGLDRATRWLVDQLRQETPMEARALAEAGRILAEVQRRCEVLSAVMRAESLAAERGTQALLGGARR
jgi:hypothetical protein